VHSLRHDPDYFGGDVAARYDETLGSMGTPEVFGPTVDLLAGLADGRALELAVGTGRVALPLAARGVPVCGIELSTDMVTQLRAKDEAQLVDVTIGDMATTRLEGTFRLVYLVFNTIGNLTTQDQQVDCFANAAAHLEPGGFFVIEVGVPDLRHLPPGDDARVFSHSRVRGLRPHRHRRPASRVTPLRRQCLDGEVTRRSAVWPSSST
jgi:SAM-dependent methyltransferase